MKRVNPFDDGRPVRKRTSDSALGAVIIAREASMFRSLVAVVALSAGFVLTALPALFAWGFLGWSVAILSVPITLGFSALAVNSWRMGVQAERSWDAKKIMAAHADHQARRARERSA